MKSVIKSVIRLVVVFSCSIVLGYSCNKDDANENKNTEPQTIVSGLLFAEGPAFYNGSLYFSDIQANKIYKWNESTGSQVFIENSGGANGLYFDVAGNLNVCEGTNKRITSIAQNKTVTVLADKFENKPFNEPNDLWIAPGGNIYFTDPVFSGTLTQTGQYVYCILSSNKQIIKVANDLVKPNGIIGNIEGTELYIADYGASEIYRYSVSPDGTLSNKQLFASVKADGLTVDSQGNIYAASDAIMIYNSQGNLTARIQISGTLTNLCIVETQNQKTLFATTHNEVFKIIL